MLGSLPACWRKRSGKGILQNEQCETYWVRHFDIFSRLKRISLVWSACNKLTKWATVVNRWLNCCLVYHYQGSIDFVLCFYRTQVHLGFDLCVQVFLTETPCWGLTDVTLVHLKDPSSLFFIWKISRASIPNIRISLVQDTIPGTLRLLGRPQNLSLFSPTEAPFTFFSCWSKNLRYLRFLLEGLSFDNLFSMFILRCMYKCMINKDCCSYEYSPVRKMCNFNRECKPAEGKVGDFLFCQKPGNLWIQDK